MLSKFHGQLGPGHPARPWKSCSGSTTQKGLIGPSTSSLPASGLHRQLRAVAGLLPRSQLTSGHRQRDLVDRGPGFGVTTVAGPSSSVPGLGHRCPALAAGGGRAGQRGVPPVFVIHLRDPLLLGGHGCLVLIFGITLGWLAPPRGRLLRVHRTPPGLKPHLLPGTCCPTRFLPAITLLITTIGTWILTMRKHDDHQRWPEDYGAGWPRAKRAAGPAGS